MTDLVFSGAGFDNKPDATVVTLYNGTGNGTGATFRSGAGAKHIQGVITGTGAVSCLVTIQVSLDGTNWLTHSTISLSGTTTDTDGFVTPTQWTHWRAVVSSASGTISDITVLMGA